VTQLAAQPLTREAFAPFGQVLAATGEAPERQEFAGRMENLRPQAIANLTFLRVDPKPPVIKVIEKHPFSTQLFVPMNNVCYLVGVCPGDSEGGPDLERLIAFIANGGQAITYDTGVWHAPLCALETAGEFVMQRWDDGGPEDTLAISIKNPVTVTYPHSDD